MWLPNTINLMKIFFFLQNQIKYLKIDQSDHNLSYKFVSDQEI